MNKGTTVLKDFRSSIYLLIEECEITYDNLKKDIKTFIHILDSINDFRDKSLITYNLSDIIMLSLLLIMKNEFKSFAYASSYLHVYKDEYIKLGLLKENQIPSHDTFRRVFMILDAQELKEAVINKLSYFLSNVLNNYNHNTKELISIDGKEFKGSGRNKNNNEKIRNTNVLNVYNVSQELCLFSKPVNSKENEIPEAQNILNKLNLKDKIITGDALHCQKETCDIIINRKGDYLFTVKENQKMLLEDIKAKISKNKETTIKETHNNCDYEIYFLNKSYAGVEFPGQKAYIKMVSNKRKNKQLNKQTIRYFISSLKDSRLIIESIDNRWKIENDLHKTKDLEMSEDDYIFTDNNAIRVMATLNNIVYSFFRITTAFLNEKEGIITKIKFKKDPMEILEKITPLLSSKNFNKLLKDHLKGAKK